MKRPIILVNEGCSMSSFTSFVIRSLIKAHGYPVDIPANNEMYVPHKNPHYKEGMSIVDLLEKTITESPNICFKLVSKLLKEPDCITLLKQKNARICFIERFNLLDNAICMLKDFGDDSNRNQHDKELAFGEWRHSKARLETKVDSSLVLDKINQLNRTRLNKVKNMQEITDQKEFIYAENLCRLDIEEYEKVFKILDYEMDKNLTKEFLKKYEIRDPYKHADVIDCSDIGAFKDELKNNGYLHFWRE
jgi:hypothetical protein